MTDRELLELAAKAAGFDDAEWDAERSCILTAKLPGFRCFWNPLISDGDALRLAVKLKIEWSYDSRRDEIWVNGYVEAEPIIDSPYTATRRAITRAAAEIGAQMKE